MQVGDDAALGGGDEPASPSPGTLRWCSRRWEAEQAVSQHNETRPDADFAWRVQAVKRTSWLDGAETYGVGTRDEMVQTITAHAGDGTMIYELTWGPTCVFFVLDHPLDDPYEAIIADDYGTTAFERAEEAVRSSFDDKYLQYIQAVMRDTYTQDVEASDAVLTWSLMRGRPSLTAAARMYIILPKFVLENTEARLRFAQHLSTHSAGGWFKRDVYHTEVPMPALESCEMGEGSTRMYLGNPESEADDAVAPTLESQIRSTLLYRPRLSMFVRSSVPYIVLESPSMQVWVQQRLRALNASSKVRLDALHRQQQSQPLDVNVSAVLSLESEVRIVERERKEGAARLARLGIKARTGDERIQTQLSEWLGRANRNSLNQDQFDTYTHVDPAADTRTLCDGTVVSGRREFNGTRPITFPDGVNTLVLGDGMGSGKTERVAGLLQAFILADSDEPAPSSFLHREDAVDACARHNKDYPLAVPWDVEERALDENLNSSSTLSPEQRERWWHPIQWEKDPHNPRRLPYYAGPIEPTPLVTTLGYHMSVPGQQTGGGLIIVPRISLSENLKTRYKHLGIPFYDEPGMTADKIRKAKWLVICINSLWKVEIVHWAVIVVDEVVGVLRALTGTGCQGQRRGPWAKWYEMTRNALHLVWLSADATPENVGLVLLRIAPGRTVAYSRCTKQLLGSNHYRFWHVHKVDDAAKTILTQLDQGKHLFVPCTECKDAKALAAHVHNRTLGKTIWVATGKGNYVYEPGVPPRELSKQEIIALITRVGAPAADLLICTSTIDMGVDASIRDWYHATYPLVNHHTINATEIMQMVGRVRHLIDKLVTFLFMPEVKSPDNPGYTALAFDPARGRNQDGYNIPPDVNLDTIEDLSPPPSAVPTVPSMRDDLERWGVSLLSQRRKKSVQAEHIEQYKAYCVESGLAPDQDVLSGSAAHLLTTVQTLGIYEAESRNRFQPLTATEIHHEWTARAASAARIKASYRAYRHRRGREAPTSTCTTLAGVIKSLVRNYQSRRAMYYKFNARTGLKLLQRRTPLDLISREVIERQVTARLRVNERLVRDSETSSGPAIPVCAMRLMDEMAQLGVDGTLSSSDRALIATMIDTAHEDANLRVTLVDDLRRKIESYGATVDTMEIFEVKEDEKEFANQKREITAQEIEAIRQARVLNDDEYTERMVRKKRGQLTPEDRADLSHTWIVKIFGEGILTRNTDDKLVKALLNRNRQRRFEESCRLLAVQDANHEVMLNLHSSIDRTGGAHVERAGEEHGAARSLVASQIVKSALGEPLHALLAGEVEWPTEPKPDLLSSIEEQRAQLVAWGESPDGEPKSATKKEQLARYKTYCEDHGLEVDERLAHRNCRKQAIEAKLTELGIFKATSDTRYKTLNARGTKAKWIRCHREHHPSAAFDGRPGDEAATRKLLDSNRNAMPAKKCRFNMCTQKSANGQYVTSDWDAMAHARQVVYHAFGMPSTKKDGEIGYPVPSAAQAEILSDFKTLHRKADMLVADEPEEGTSQPMHTEEVSDVDEEEDDGSETAEGGEASTTSGGLSAGPPRKRART